MKKYFTAIMFCIAALFLSACSSEKLYESEKMNAYERTEYPLTKEYPDTTIHVMNNSKQKCLYYESRFEYEDGESTFVVKDIYEYDYNTGKVSKMDSLTEEEKYYGCIYVWENELLVCDTECSNIYLMDSQHKVIAKNNLQELSFPGQDAQKCCMTLRLDIKSDENYVYLNGKNQYNQGMVLILDSNLEEKSVFFSDNGWTLMPMYENKIRLVDNKTHHLYEYKEEKNALDDVGKIADNVLDPTFTAGYCQGNSEYDFFYYTRNNQNKENGIRQDYLAGVKDGEQVIVFDFTAMGIDDLYIESITPDSRDGFWVWGTLSDEKHVQEMVLYHFALSEKVQDYSMKSGKTCCRIGSLFSPNPETKSAIMQFNRQSEDYYFETVVYGEIYEDRNIAITHLFLDCQEGKLDGVILDQIEDELVKNDVLYDLENYLTQSKVVSKDSFLTHYLESVTDREGRIYALYPSFRAFGYAYDEHIDFSDLLKYEDLCEENKTFLSSQGVENDLGFLLTYSGNTIVDEDNGEIHVKEDAFRSMLQFLKAQSTRKKKNFDCVMQYCEGESSATRIQISEPCDYLYFNELFHNNVVFTNVGKDGLVIGERKGLLGICNTSENKEAIFAFYDFLFEPVFYHNAFFVGLNMPVLKEEYKLWEDYFLATKDYEDKYGKYNRKYDFQIGIGAAECIIEVGSITEQEAKEAVTVLQEVQYVKPMRTAYKNIILEEAAAYFAGNRDLDEVCDNMEKRLEIALKENRN